MRKNNKVLLQNWYKQIAHYPQMSFEEAKKAFLDMKEEPNEKIREQKRQQLICSTLYVVYKLLLRMDCFSMFSAASYDFEDILSSACELWIRCLDDGVPFKKNSFGVFNRGFYLKLAELLHFSYGQVSCEFDTFIPSNFNELFMRYVRLKDQQEEVNLVDLLRDAKNENQEGNGWGSSYDSVCLSQIFEWIYESLHLEENTSFPLTQRKLFLLKEFFLENGFCFSQENIGDIGINDPCDILIDGYNQEEMMDIIFHDEFLKDRQKDILYRYFFERQTFQEIGDDLHVCGERVRQVAHNTTEKLALCPRLKIRRK